MSEQLFEVTTGLSLNNASHMLYGTGYPGESEETNSAPISSSYSNIIDGSTWQKVGAGSGAATWVELAGKDAAIVVEHISSTGTILDQVQVKKSTEFAWAVTAINEADFKNKYSCIIHMSHNGTATADATNVVFDNSSILRQGAKIAGLQIIGTLTGTDGEQFMNLHVSSQTMVTFIAYRMVKNVAGSNTMILGGANLSNHIADGTVHLMPWQNTLLDGLSQSLNSTQINSLLGVTSNIQAQLDAKSPLVPTTTGSPYDLGIAVFGTPSASEVVYRFLTAREFIIPTDFAGSVAKTGTVATSSTVFYVQKNGVQFGTVSFAAGSVTGVFSTQASVTFAMNDRVSVIAPTIPDSTLADIDITIKASLA